MNHKRPPPEGKNLKTTRKKKEKPGSFSFQGSMREPLLINNKHCSTYSRQTQDVVLMLRGASPDFNTISHSRVRNSRWRFH